MYYGISKAQITCLQVVQNAATQVLKGCGKFPHVTPLLKDFRIEFKILLLFYKSLHNQTPSYLSNLL